MARFLVGTCPSVEVHGTAMAGGDNAQAVWQITPSIRSVAGYGDATTPQNVFAQRDIRVGEGSEGEDEDGGSTKLCLPRPVKLVDSPHTDSVVVRDEPDEGALLGMCTTLKLLNDRISQIKQNPVYCIRTFHIVFSSAGLMEWKERINAASYRKRRVCVQLSRGISGAKLRA